MSKLVDQMEGNGLSSSASVPENLGLGNTNVGTLIGIDPQILSIQSFDTLHLWLHHFNLRQKSIFVKHNNDINVLHHEINMLKENIKLFTSNMNKFLKSILEAGNSGIVEKVDPPKKKTSSKTNSPVKKVNPPKKRKKVSQGSTVQGSVNQSVKKVSFEPPCNQNPQDRVYETCTSSAPVSIFISSTMPEIQMASSSPSPPPNPSVSVYSTSAPSHIIDGKITSGEDMKISILTEFINQYVIVTSYDTSISMTNFNKIFNGYAARMYYKNFEQHESTNLLEKMGYIIHDKDNEKYLSYYTLQYNDLLNRLA